MSIGLGTCRNCGQYGGVAGLIPRCGRCTEHIDELNRQRDREAMGGGAILRDEIDRLRAALATAQAERDAAILRAEAAERKENEYRAACEMSIDALRTSREQWQQRAEQAEAALAQAQATLQDVRDDLASDEALGCEPDLSDYVARLKAALEATR